MDNVIDVVTRISYQVDPSGLTSTINALRQIEAQTQSQSANAANQLNTTNTQIEKLLQSLKRLQQAYAATSDTELAKRAAIQKAQDARLEALQRELTLLGQISKAAATASPTTPLPNRPNPAVPRPRPAPGGGGTLPATPTNEDIVNVNRYAGAQLALMQIIREAPSAAVGLQVFFLAISNNIPILVDQIQKLRAEGTKSGDIFYSLATSLFSVNNLITIGITLLTVFSKNIFQSGKSAEQAAADYKKLTDSLLQIVNAVNETNVALDKLFQDRGQAAQNYADLIKAQGVVQGKTFEAEQNQLKATQDARRAQNEVLESQIQLYKQIEDVVLKTGREGKTALNLALAPLIPDDKDRKKAIDDVMSIMAESDKANENRNDLRLRVRGIFLKDVLKLETDKLENTRQNELDQIAFESKTAEAQYQLTKQLNANIREQDKERAVANIELLTAVSGQRLNLLKKRIDVETKFSIDQIDAEEKTASDAGTLNAKNEAKFAQMRNNIRKTAEIEWSKTRFEFLRDQIKEEIALYMDLNSQELNLSNKQLKSQLEIGEDTFAKRQQIAQQETQVQLDEVNKRYEALREAAIKSGSDLVQIGKDYQSELDQVNADGQRRQLQVEQAYFEDVKKAIDQEHQYRLHAITANSSMQYSRMRQTNRENLRAARAELASANVYGARITDNDLATPADLDKAADAINQAQTKVNDAQKAIRNEAIDNSLKIVEAYRTMADSIVGVFQTIYQAQSAYLDREISYREDRMAYAVELARHGNTEVLENEQKALQQAQEERERVAQRQLQLNAIVQASNSAVALTEAIGAVVKAAAEGDPYTIAARVAAAVASLVAGVAAVTSAFSGLDRGYAEGGYTGDGSKYQVAGTVHKGEFVFTKEETARHRAQFEQIRATGKFPVIRTAMVDSSAGPAMSMREFAALSDRMGEVKDAIENIEGAQMNVNERGIYMLAMRARKFNKNRFNA